MRNRVLFAIFALFAATACSSSDTDQLIIPEGGNQEVVIPEGNDVFELTTSAIAPEEEVRAGFTDAQKTQTVWYKGDQIRLTSLAGASAVLTNELEQGNNAFFRGTGTAAAEIDTYFAAYPSSLDLHTDGKVVMDFSKVQDGSEQNAIMAAGWCESVGKNEIVMGFTPINALLYVTVANLPAGYTIYEVKFSDLDTLLPGSQTYDISAASYGTMTTEGGLTHYTINTSATNFFIALPAYYTPTTGYVLTVKAKDGAGQEYCTVGAFGAQGGFSAGSTSYVTFDWTKNGISTIGPKTSYDLYLANNSAANTANTGQLVYCDANNATTYTMQNTLINKGFITNVGYVYDGTEFNTGSGIVWDQSNKQFYVGGNLDGQSKAAHSLEVFMTTKLGDRIVVRKTLHVTGIPYSYSRFSSLPSDWSWSNARIWQSRIKLLQENAYLVTQYCWIPADISAKVSFDAHAYGGTIPNEYNPSVYISESTTGVAAGSAIVMDDDMNSGLFPEEATFTNLYKVITLSSSGRVCVYTKGKGSSWAATVEGGHGVCVEDFSLNYNI